MDGGAAAPVGRPDEPDRPQDVEGEFDVAKQSEKINITPTTMADLKANPADAIQNAATFNHAKSVKLANTMFRTNLEPFSGAGVVTGAAVLSAKGVAIHEGVDKASGAAESQIKSRVG